MALKSYLWKLIVPTILAFVANRHLVRSWVLENVEHELPVIVVNSLPSLVEGIMGTLLLTSLATEIWARSRDEKDPLESSRFYLTTSAMSALYIVTEELNWHGLSSVNNTFDWFDIGAALLGVAFVNRLLTKHGLMQSRRA
jgi:hypothetical protein